MDTSWSIDPAPLLGDVLEQATRLRGQGRVADYIPALAGVDPSRCGMALAMLDGRVFSVGDASAPFSIQSISKVFSLSLVLARVGESLWERCGREPSGNPFNSLVQLEQEGGIPRNPFINAGALIVCASLAAHAANPRVLLRDQLRLLAGNPRIDFDATVAASEAAHGHRNAALAHFMKSFGVFQGEVEPVLDLYFHQCSIAMSCIELARAALFLANRGTDPRSGIAWLSPLQARRVTALMLTCGAYDAAGDLAYNVGLPLKSGVGGGIVAVIPGQAALCVWAPELDDTGNSVVGVEALRLFVERTGVSIF